MYQFSVLTLLVAFELRFLWLGRSDATMPFSSALSLDRSNSLSTFGLVTLRCDVQSRQVPLCFVATTKGTSRRGQRDRLHL